MSRTYTKLALTPSGRLDSDKTEVQCEAPGCTKSVIIGQSYSFVVTFATTGPLLISSFQCKEEQHFACSPECARAAAIMCIDEHLITAHKGKVAEQTQTTVTELPQQSALE